GCDSSQATVVVGIDARVRRDHGEAGTLEPVEGTSDRNRRFVWMDQKVGQALRLLGVGRAEAAAHERTKDSGARDPDASFRVSQAQQPDQAADRKNVQATDRVVQADDQDSTGSNSARDRVEAALGLASVVEHAQRYDD